MSIVILQGLHPFPHDTFAGAKGTSLIKGCSPAALAPGSAEGGSLGRTLRVADKSQGLHC